MARRPPDTDPTDRAVDGRPRTRGRRPRAAEAEAADGASDQPAGDEGPCRGRAEPPRRQVARRCWDRAITATKPGHLQVLRPAGEGQPPPAPGAEPPVRARVHQDVRGEYSGLHWVAGNARDALRPALTAADIRDGQQFLGHHDGRRVVAGIRRHLLPHRPPDPVNNKGGRGSPLLWRLAGAPPLPDMFATLVGICRAASSTQLNATATPGLRPGPLARPGRLRLSAIPGCRSQTAQRWRELGFLCRGQCRQRLQNLAAAGVPPGTCQDR